MFLKNIWAPRKCFWKTLGNVIMTMIISYTLDPLLYVHFKPDPVFPLMKSPKAFHFDKSEIQNPNKAPHDLVTYYLYDLNTYSSPGSLCSKHTNQRFL